MIYISEWDMGESFNKALDDDRNKTPTHSEYPKALVCPACGENYLHHTYIEIFTRKQEDGISLCTLVRENGSVGFKHITGPGNPSPRRDAVSIHFWCEHCGKNPVLNVIQHKGQTFLKWGDTR